MIRTQVQLTEEQVEELRRRSAREKVSVAELIRRVVETYTRLGPPSTPERRRRALAVAGRFASGKSDTSTRHDEALAESSRSR